MRPWSDQLGVILGGSVQRRERGTVAAIRPARFEQRKLQHDPAVRVRGIDQRSGGGNARVTPEQPGEPRRASRLGCGEMRSHVTIIIPTYNRARQVTQAIDSALGQTYPYLDVVVVDDGSTDETLDVLRGYDAEPRLHIVRLPRNMGVTAAKNAGMANVPAETIYLGILDSDDTLLPSAVDTLVRVFDADEGRYSQVYGWCVERTTGELMGRMPYREGPVRYEDALSGRFSGEFWQLASCRLLNGKRFDERAAGGESAVWWPLLKQREGWLIGDVVRQYDTL